MAKEMMTLATICDGAVQERVNHALQKISENILDPNTDPAKKRSLTLTLTFKPKSIDREDVTVEVAVGAKLAPESGLETRLFLSKDLGSGVVSITEHSKGQIKGQLSFDDLELSERNTAPPTAEELGCDPETGEVPEGGESNVIDLRKSKVQ